MTIQNPLATAEGARRYLAGRPYHHPRTLDRIFSILGRQQVGRALDVACGSGLSTVALSEKTGFTVGVDAVEAMVRLAPTSQNMVVSISEAEKLPFSGNTFELMTVSSGVHWFDQKRFFREAARVLEAKGWPCHLRSLLRGLSA